MCIYLHTPWFVGVLFMHKKAQPNWLGKRAFIKHLTTEIVSNGQRVSAYADSTIVFISVI
jgi:hypothetical protein